MILIPKIIGHYILESRFQTKCHRSEYATVLGPARVLKSKVTVRTVPWLSIIYFPYLNCFSEKKRFFCIFDLFRFR